LTVGRESERGEERKKDLLVNSYQKKKGGGIKCTFTFCNT